MNISQLNEDIILSRLRGSFEPVEELLSIDPSPNEFYRQFYNKYLLSFDQVNEFVLEYFKIFKSMLVKDRVRQTITTYKLADKSIKNLVYSDRRELMGIIVKCVDDPRKDFPELPQFISTGDFLTDVVFALKSPKTTVDSNLNYIIKRFRAE